MRIDRKANQNGWPFLFSGEPWSIDGVHQSGLELFTSDIDANLVIVSDRANLLTAIGRSVIYKHMERAHVLIYLQDEADVGLWINIRLEAGRAIWQTKCRAPRAACIACRA